MAEGGRHDSPHGLAGRVLLKVIMPKAGERGEGFGGVRRRPPDRLAPPASRGDGPSTTTTSANTIGTTTVGGGGGGGGGGGRKAKDDGDGREGRWWCFPLTCLCRTMSLAQVWDNLVDCICRPPRDSYKTSDLIGGESGHFVIGNTRGVREDSEITNKNGQKLQCSFFRPEKWEEKDSKLPCVVYCHCNSGSRRDADEAVVLLLPQRICIFTLDFAGSGRSDGDWVSLGAREVDDLEVAVAHLRAQNRTSTIALWGRSMGAVTALLYCRRDPCITGMVLDSPFTKLTELMLDFVQEHILHIPRPFLKIALIAMRRSVRRRAGFDVKQVAPIKTVSESFVPVLFGHAEGDTFVKKSHSVRLHEKYAGDKNLVTFEGEHNSRRPQFFYSSALIFFLNAFQINGDAELEEVRRAMSNRRLQNMQLPTGSGHAIGETNMPWSRPAAAGFDPRSVDNPSASRPLNQEATQQEPGSLPSSSPDSVGVERQRLPEAQRESWQHLIPDSEEAENAMLFAAMKESFHQKCSQSGQAWQPDEPHVVDDLTIVALPTQFDDVRASRSTSAQGSGSRSDPSFRQEELRGLTIVRPPPQFDTDTIPEEDEHSGEGLSSEDRGN